TPTPTASATPSDILILTPSPTATPTPTFTPTPADTPTPIPPTPTPTKVVELGIALPFDFGSQRASTTGDPDEPVTWRVALPGEYFNDASAHIQFEPDFASDEIPLTGAGGGFIVGDMPERAEADLDGRQSLVDAVVNIPAGSLQELGTGNHAITGNMIVDVA